MVVIRVVCVGDLDLGGIIIILVVLNNFCCVIGIYWFRFVVWLFLIGYYGLFWCLVVLCIDWKMFIDVV